MTQENAKKILETLMAMINDNIGNKITQLVGSGIVGNINILLSQMLKEEQEKTVKPTTEVVEK